MNVLHIVNTSKTDGCTYYRNLLPSLYSQAAALDDCKITNKFTTRIVENKKTGKKEVFFELGMIAWAHVVVLSRFFDKNAAPLVYTVFEAAKHYKTAVVYETDDDFFNIPVDNPVYKEIHDNPTINETRLYMMEHADAFTTTTKRLADTLTENYPGKKCFVMPNSVELSRFSLNSDLGLIRRKTKDKIRIGWAGGSTHIKDFIGTGCKGALKELIESRDDIEFVSMGSSNVDEVLDFKHTFIPYAPIDIFPEALRNLDLDIALCPLEDTPFNKNKSAIKWEEYSACKYTTVYSNVPPYSDVITHNKTGLAVDNTKDSWKGAIEILIEDKALRTRLANQALAKVYKDYNMENNFIQWHSAYKQVLKR